MGSRRASSILRPRRVRRAAGGWAILAACLLSLAAAPFGRAQPVRGRSAGASRFVQRSLRLLAESRPTHRHTVRVLFYGQSITEQGWAEGRGWAREVERSLRRRFPHADLVIENRGLGGFASQLLVRAAETDLYAFYPDLVIFHVYGAHDKYEQIVRNLRARTTAEILLQTDHPTAPEELEEGRDLARAGVRAGAPEPEQYIDRLRWSTFMNQLWLPELARRYDAALCDVRGAWKQFLAQHAQAPAALLKDEVHLNPRGEARMATYVEACLRRDPSLGRSPAEDWVRTLEVGRDLRWQDGLLRLSFVGNRVDALTAPDEAGAEEQREPTRVWIDGRPPSAWPELYGWTRALPSTGGPWPALVGLRSEAPLLLERWELSVSTESREPERYAFRLWGSRTGPDGEGRSDQPFVSRSRRVVIPPDGWLVRYVMGLVGQREVPEHFRISWDVVPRFVDAFVPTRTRAGSEAAVTLAEGLPNGPHVLELRGPPSALRGLRVYRPPLEPGPPPSL
jgi:lysophospholipase L1-like esterase